MSSVVGTFRLLDVLKAEQFPLPDHCRTVHLEMGADQAFILHYEVMVTDENLIKLGRALQRLGQEPR